MNRLSKHLLCCLTALLLCPGLLHAGEWSGHIEGQARYFTQQPNDSAQAGADFSLALQPEYYHRWDHGRQSLLFVPFARWDNRDSARSHADIRELIWTHAGNGYETRAGIGKVFWGVTEAQHLVDVINQTDLVENPDGEQKLGQPMLKLSLERDWGIFDIYLLPGFRQRTFPGREGRLRTHPRVDTDLVVYESARKARHVDLAVRWSHSIGDWDIGLSHFSGTSRDPTFIPRLTAAGEPVMAPYYALMHQTGLDLQATKGDWLWKLEAIHRRTDSSSYNASTGGFEYTLVGIGDSVMDLGLLAEYLYDGRGEAATTPFEGDLFLGIRLTANDVDGSELLTGVIRDRDSSATLFNLEASRRIGNAWKASAQVRFWFGVSDDDPLATLRHDDYCELTLARYF
ncbi:MAG: hypothetical protein P8178_02730 [Candidatus Thiodiazotropha sp.]